MRLARFDRFEDFDHVNSYEVRINSDFVRTKVEAHCFDRPPQFANHLA